MADGVSARDTQPMYRIADPFPLTLAGIVGDARPAGDQLRISVGSGEAYLLPNIGARGTFNMHWLMLISVVLEAALVYECIKLGMNTGRSRSSPLPRTWGRRASGRGTGPLSLPFSWPAGQPGWAGRSSPGQFEHLDPRAAAQRQAATAVHLGGDRAGARACHVLPLGPHLQVPGAGADFFLVIMWANIILVVVITGIAAKPHHYWDVLKGCSACLPDRGQYPAVCP